MLTNEGSDPVGVIATVGEKSQHDQTRFGRYQPESGPVILSLSFVDPDPKRTYRTFGLLSQSSRTGLALSQEN
jgi:hypothetical protein